MATHNINSFIQHLMNEGMTTTGTQGRGGSSRPEQRSGDGTHPKDQSTEDGGLMPYFEPSEKPYWDFSRNFLDYIIRSKYTDPGDFASPDALDPDHVRYVYNIDPWQYTPGRGPTPQDLVDILDAPSPGYPSKIDPTDDQGPRRGFGLRKPGPYPFGVFDPRRNPVKP